MSSTKAHLNIKIDRGVKETAAQLLESMGLNHTTAVELFYRQIIKERRLPFQPASPLSLDEQLLEAIRRKNIPRRKLEVNDKGHIVVDKNKDPDLYDWAVNG